VSQRLLFLQAALFDGVPEERVYLSREAVRARATLVITTAGEGKLPPMHPKVEPLRRPVAPAPGPSYADTMRYSHGDREKPEPKVQHTARFTIDLFR
jgi:hypothetical protein